MTQYLESFYKIKDIDLEILWKTRYNKRVRFKNLIPNWGTSYALSYYLPYQYKEEYIVTKQWIDGCFDEKPNPKLFMIFHILIQDEFLLEGNYLIINSSF